MTDGEKMIYAAALVMEREDRRRCLRAAGCEITDVLEISAMVSAAEHAYWTVNYMRDALSGIADNFGKEDDIYVSALEMLS